MEIKSLRITENKIVYKRFFGISSKEYDFTEITGYKSKIRKNQSLHFVLQINSKEHICINDTLISNFRNVDKEIKKILPYYNSVEDPIISLKDKMLILGVISFSFSLFWFLINIYHEFM